MPKERLLSYCFQLNCKKILHCEQKQKTLPDFQKLQFQEFSTKIIKNNESFYC